MPVRVDVRAQASASYAMRSPRLCARLGESVELLGQAGVVPHRLGQRRGAHQQGVAAELLHDVELALGSDQVARERRVVHGIQIAERLIQIEGESEICCAGSQLTRRPRRAHEIGFEHLESVEPGCRDRGDLLLQRSAQGYRGNARTNCRPMVRQPLLQMKSTASA